MGGSRRSPRPECGSGNEVGRELRAFLAQALPAGGVVAVALSGGRDSIALADATAAIVDADRSFRLMAFHVHHGLSPNADAWASLCARACAAHGVPLRVRNVDVKNAGDGVEASARKVRYDALASLAREHRVDAVLLAHHADDQAETLLLQLLRGSGPRGLAAMPADSVDRGARWLRPFLALPREAIDDYVRSHGLTYADDESNASPHFRRNALRADAVPALRRIAPGYPATLVRAARQQAEAAALLDDLARLDAAQAYDGGGLDLGALRSLDASRARNLFRWFLHERELRSPSAARLDEMLRQLRQAAPDARVAIEHEQAVIGVHRGRAVVHGRPTPPFAREWRGESEIPLAHGVLAFVPTYGDGIAKRYLEAARVTIRAGIPGERLRLVPGGGRRHVADLLREAGIPAWDRAGLPRIDCDDRLAAVACAGVDAAFRAVPGEAGFTLAWTPRTG